MAKRIMILGASILQLPAITKALKMGLAPVVVDMNPNAVGFVDGAIKEVISTIDVPGIVAAAKRNNVDGVMTLATDMPMRAVAAVAKEMGLVGISNDTALKATNKAFMREALAAHSVPVPKFYRVKDRGEYKKAAEQFSSPFIVKPADNSGSRGIYLIKDLSDSKQINAAYEYSHQFSRSGDVVVEEYMSGPEVSVETLAIDGEIHVIQITDKITTANLNAIKGMGRSDLFLKLEIIKKVVGLAALAITLPISVMAMGYSLLFTSVASQIINSWPNRKLLNYRYIDQLKDILPNILLAVGMGITVWTVSLLHLPVLLTVLIQILLGAGIYIGGSLLFRMESFNYIISVLKEYRKKKNA